MGKYTKPQYHQQQSQLKDPPQALCLLMEQNYSISSTYTARMSCNAMPRMEQSEAHLHRSLCRSLEFPRTARASARTGGSQGIENLRFLSAIRS
uniref:Uncharacterized protein n=1 Tax=Arundo donax TaxID=35708 RepID=A0A0A9AIZ5_ARUDO